VRWWSLAAQAGGAPRVAVDAVARQLRQAAVSSGYRLDDLVAVLEGRPISAADAPRTSIAVRPTPAGAPPAGAPRADRPSR
jgi:hypothetical protein